MAIQHLKNMNIQQLLQEGYELPLAMKHYPSRGQTAVQKLYQTKIGKLFLKEVSKRNHEECKIDIVSGTLAEREYWAFLLAQEMKLNVPELILLNESTTVQRWLDYPDANTFMTEQGKLTFKAENVFECALFDYLTGQIDRHDENYLYNFSDKEILLIDSAHAFLIFDGSMPDYLKLFEASNQEMLTKKMEVLAKRMLKSLNTKELQKLVPLRNAEEGKTLVKRYEQLSTVKSISDVIALYRGRKR